MRVDDWAHTLIHSRQTILPKRLVAPGPDAHQLGQIVGAAAAAPDHGQLLPWRFVLVPAPVRGALADTFEQALVLRDPLATETQRDQAREKAFRAPVLLLAVVRSPDGDPPLPPGAERREVPDAERILSAGCAIQNMLLMATALGFGSALTTGKALQSAPLRALFRLGEHERALTFISIGTASQRKPGRLRPEPGQYLSTLEAP
jgi:nitroreductase